MRRFYKGFTLAELLVCAVLILALTAVVITSVQGLMVGKDKDLLTQHVRILNAQIQSMDTLTYFGANMRPTDETEESVLRKIYNDPTTSDHLRNLLVHKGSEMGAVNEATYTLEGFMLNLGVQPTTSKYTIEWKPNERLFSVKEVLNEEQ